MFKKWVPFSEKLRTSNLITKCRLAREKIKEELAKQNDSEKLGFEIYTKFLKTDKISEDILVSVFSNMIVNQELPKNKIDEKLFDKLLKDVGEKFGNLLVERLRKKIEEGQINQNSSAKKESSSPQNQISGPSSVEKISDIDTKEKSSR